MTHSTEQFDEKRWSDRAREIDDENPEGEAHDLLMRFAREIHDAAHASGKAEGVREEREACAKVCEKLAGAARASTLGLTDPSRTFDVAANEIRRSRSTET